MEMKQLEIFVCVAKNASFSKAAELLYISQPNVSTSIQALEGDLGIQLLIRNTKEVSLTKGGAEFLTYAQNILSLRDQALRGIRGEDPDAKGTIDIIASTIPAQHLLPEIITSFQEMRPNTVFHIEQADSRTVEREMGRFRYDFGMTGTAPEGDRLVACPVYDDELVLILPNDMPYGEDEIRAGFSQFILRTPFVMRESGSGTRAEIEGLLAKLGVEPRELHIPAYFSDAHGILLAVSRGMGVSLISRVAASLYVEAGMLRAVGMNRPIFHRKIHLLHNKELFLSPLQQAFADHAGTFYGTADETQEVPE